MWRFSWHSACWFLSGTAAAPSSIRFLACLSAERAGSAALGIAGLLTAPLFSGDDELGAEVVDEQHYTRLATNLGEATASHGDRSADVGPAATVGISRRRLDRRRAEQLPGGAARSDPAGALTTALVHPGIGCSTGASLAMRPPCSGCPSLVFFDFAILTETLFAPARVRAAGGASGSGAEGRDCAGLQASLVARREASSAPPLVLCPLLIVFWRRPLQTRILLRRVAGYGVAVVPGPRTRGFRADGNRGYDGG
jgi:hypothetical protein